MSNTVSVQNGVAPKAQPVTFNAGSRPYRSHKVRACDLCRKRKARCTVDIPGQSCLLCRVQGADCHYREESSQDSWPVEQLAAGQKRKRTPELTPTPPQDGSRSPSDRIYGHSLLHRESGRQSSSRSRGPEDPKNESVHIVGPVAAEDAQVIEKFMPPERSNKSPESRKNPYNVYSNDPRKPILYTTVSRRRQGMRMGNPPGENQKEILEQILGPFKDDLVKLFIERSNQCFPIFDGEAFWESYLSGSTDDPPTTLLCQVYAMSLVYWKHTPKLARHPKPDVRYAVNLTVAALHEDFSAPGLSTIGAALIDLTGRPIFSMTGNAINCGRTVSLAHCLGLNRDPSNWKLSAQEKNQRIRLWWGVVIVDRWGSFGHGVPPSISKTQYDVPLPTVDVLVPSNDRNPQRVKRAYCYIALCRLTEILGELLPLVYGLQPKSVKETSKRLRHIRTNLDTWEDSLPDWLKSPQRSDAPVSGACSLQLGFLALKMLICRVELHEINNSDTENPEARRYFQTECRKSAEEIVQFISSLRKENFQEFWLPYSAFHLTSTATLLVRCALETTDPEVSRSCLANVDSFRSVLRRVRDEDDWDVADMCLDHCDKILHRAPSNNSHAAGSSDVRLTTAAPEPSTVNPAAIALPETQTHNEIVDDMMSISGTFGTMDGFPFDMTGIWDVTGFQDANFT
ncbi:transcriptional regulator family: Fungal Specific TF [Paecilomyces variotii]|nr:transcriptional regulator family: Fungal Specific TF [Paecilomyces variotii]